MTEPVRFALTGKNSRQWNKVFKTLSNTIISGVSQIVPASNHEGLGEAKQVISAIAELSKTWVKAKVERPSLENEKLYAEIVSLFEEAKIKRATREKLELENDSLRLDLMVKRVSTAIKLLGMLQNCCSVDSHGNLTLVLTNENLAVYHAEMKSLVE